MVYSMAYLSGPSTYRAAPSFSGVLLSDRLQLVSCAKMELLNLSRANRFKDLLVAEECGVGFYKSAEDH